MRGGYLSSNNRAMRRRPWGRGGWTRGTPRQRTDVNFVSEEIEGASDNNEVAKDPLEEGELNEADYSTGEQYEDPMGEEAEAPLAEDRNQAAPPPYAE